MCIGRLYVEVVALMLCISHAIGSVTISSVARIPILYDLREHDRRLFRRGTETYPLSLVDMMPGPEDEDDQS